nr:MAG TPA_asm: hypothetical protein [Caudoviricetes sp.]
MNHNSFSNKFLSFALQKVLCINIKCRRDAD